MRFKALILLAMLTVPVLDTAAFADAIAERQEAMKAIGKAIGAVGAIVKGEAAFDAAVVDTNGRRMAAEFKAAESLWPESSNVGKPKTRAKPAIWQNMAEFTAGLQASAAAADALAKVTSADQLPAALGKLGATCKSCHEKYRAPKD